MIWPSMILVWFCGVCVGFALVVPLVASVRAKRAFVSALSSQ